MGSTRGERWGGKGHQTLPGPVVGVSVGQAAPPQPAPPHSQPLLLNLFLHPSTQELKRQNLNSELLSLECQDGGQGGDGSPLGPTPQIRGVLYLGVLVLPSLWVGLNPDCLS